MKAYRSNLINFSKFTNALIKKRKRKALIQQSLRTGESLSLHIVKQNFSFLSGFSFTNIMIQGQQGKGEVISLFAFYHFHPFHWHLDISQVIATENSPLRIVNSWTRTENLRFPSASR